MRYRSFAAAVTLAVLFLAAGQPVSADIRFAPQLFLQIGHLDDVGFGGDSVTTADTSDTITRIAIELPIERTTRTGTLQFLYRPEYEKFSDFEDLDNFGQQLTLSGTRKANRRMTTGFSLSFEQTQQQARPGAEGTPDLFVATRTDRDLLMGTFDFQHEISNRWSGRLDLSVSDYSFSAIVADGLVDPMEVVLEDRREYAVGYGVNYALTADDKIGVEVRAERFDFESGSEDEVVSLAAVWGKKLGEHGELRVSLGLFSADATPLTGPATSDDGVVAALRFERETGPAVLSLGLSRRPQPASSFSEVVTTDSLIFTIQAREAARWNWYGSADWARREGTGSISELERISIAGTVERRFGKMHALRWDGQWFDQSVDDPLAVEGSFSQFFMSWVWYPRGWSRGGS